jgi:membrane protease YdiL (CAAX protease family)
MSAANRVDEMRLWQLAVVEAIFVCLAALIIGFRHLAGAPGPRLPIPVEVAIGLPLGLVAGAPIGWGLLRSPLRGSVVRGVVPMRTIVSARWSILAASVMAGFAEELLFRAALQTWIGIGWASVLFGLAHSGTARLQEGLSPGKLAYLVVAVGAGVLLGLLYRAAGLAAAMSAHAGFDAGILLVLAPAIAAAAREIPEAEATDPTPAPPAGRTAGG